MATASGYKSATAFSCQSCDESDLFSRLRLKEELRTGMKSPCPCCMSMSSGCAEWSSGIELSQSIRDGGVHDDGFAETA